MPDLVHVGLHACILSHLADFGIICRPCSSEFATTDDRQSNEMDAEQIGCRMLRQRTSVVTCREIVSTAWRRMSVRSRSVTNGRIACDRQAALMKWPERL